MLSLLESALTNTFRVLPCFGRTRLSASSLESALAEFPSLTSLESALTKTPGEGGPFKCQIAFPPNASPRDQHLAEREAKPLRKVVSLHAMNYLVNEAECRVLGSLIEKEITTPEYYPLSLNALVNACNQKSNRDPVMNLDEAAVRQALHSLDGQSLVRSVSASDSRVTKYEHRLQEAFNFYRHEVAILCVLLLRGPQTPGELRTRAERMHPFEDLSAVQSSLQHLMKREPSLVKILPRQPGTKEARYAHLLSGEQAEWDAKPAPELMHITASADGERVAQLEREVAALRSEVKVLQKESVELQQQFAAFRKQFE